MGVVVLAGGTGGAKLARGLQDILGPELAVIANTADDVRLLGVHVSPDPDLCTYWLTDEIDTERGWGIAGDRFAVFERMVQMGAPSWFRLSDRDLATCLWRRALLDAGNRPTEAQRAISDGLGARARVLPMCDEPVETAIRTSEGWRGFQEFLIQDRAALAIEAIELRGIEDARPTPEAREALASAEMVIIGPSNPVVSIGPILAVPGMRDLIAAAPGPVVAVSPFVAGRAVKGPTEPFMEAVGRPPSAAGVAELYADVIDGLVVDAGDPEPAPRSVRTAALPTLMDGPGERRTVAEQTLEFARSLAP